jgi:quercetin dioxygenase-like cupin family protein
MAGGLIRTGDEFDARFEGFGDAAVGGDVKEEKGFTRVLAGPDATYQELASQRFSTKRLQVGHHAFEPGITHDLHTHDTWEQFYFVVSGKAKITVGDEVEVVGPGAAAYVPPGMPHAFEPADGPLELLVIGAVLDDDM